MQQWIQYYSVRSVSPQELGCG